MKHDLKITVFLVLLFLCAQIIGLSIISKSIQIEKSTTGEITLVHEDTVVGPRPDVGSWGALAYIGIGILFGTIILLILVKYRANLTWKIWFFLAIWMSSWIALGVLTNKIIALVLALVIALLKVYKPGTLINNVAELLMYSGIAVFFVPLFKQNLWAIFLLLLAISLYDVYAVWKSRHMVKLANFQTESKLFAGLVIPYKREEVKKVEGLTQKKVTNGAVKQKKTTNAILGGGDISFPLLFSGVIMEHLVTGGMTKQQALLNASIIPITAAIALFLLLFYAKKDKFYPAMPFISAGCVAGYLVIIGIGLF